MLGMDAAVVLAALASTLPPPTPVEPQRPRIPEGPARTVGQAVRRAHLTGAISWTGRREYEEQLKVAKAAARRLPAARARQVRGSLLVARRIAAQGRLGPERLNAVMTSIRATTEVMRHRPMPRSTERLSVELSGLVYEFRPGAGVQPHPLASAGRLNGLASACLHKRRAACRPAALSRAADDLEMYGVQDGSRLRFEYLFPFGRGKPPWTSSMAQATAAQALSRAAEVTGERRHAIAASRAYRALVSPSTAVRRGGRVEHFAMYSFQRSMRVLNGELQTLVGLADYARMARSRKARRVLGHTARGMARSFGAWDTGAWTLYSAGGREATLHYHGLAATFAGRACDQRLARGFCPAAKRFARYTVEPPRLSIRVAERVTAPRRVRVRLRASKLTDSALVVRGPRGYRARFALDDLGRHGASVRFPARRAGRFRLVLSGTAVNGRRDVTRALVRVKPDPAIKRRREARRRAARRRAARQQRERRERAQRERRKRSERASPPPADRPAA